jgi:hypothetical protein
MSTYTSTPNIPIIGGNVPILGQEPEPQQPQGDQRNMLIAELMTVVSYNAEVYKAISDDVTGALARIDLPDHSLQKRLLRSIGEACTEALTTDPMAGALLRMEAGLVSKFIRFVIKTAEDDFTADEAALVQKVIESALRKTEERMAEMTEEVAQADVAVAAPETEESNGADTNIN